MSPIVMTRRTRLAMFGNMRLLTSSGVFAVLLVPTLAFGQDEASISAARTLGQEGVLAAQAGRCDEAVDKLSRVKALVNAPTILVPLGECQITLGKIVAGTENLQAAARMKLADNAPKAFGDAQDHARQLLPEALKKLGRLTIAVEAPEGTALTIKDNSDLVSSVLVGAERPADPGKHVIVVTAPGFKKATAEVDVTSGSKQSVKLTLEIDPTAKATPPEPPVSPGGPVALVAPKPPEEPHSSSPLVPAGAVVLGVGGVGLVLGTVFGVLATSKKSSLDKVCNASKACPASAQGDIDGLNTFGDASTATFVVGGIGVAVGAALLGIGLSANNKSPQTAIAPIVGPGYVGLGGQF